MDPIVILWIVLIVGLILMFCFLVGGYQVGEGFSWGKGILFVGVCVAIFVVAGLITWAVQGG